MPVWCRALPNLPRNVDLATRFAGLLVSVARRSHERRLRLARRDAAAMRTIRDVAESMRQYEDNVFAATDVDSPEPFFDRLVDTTASVFAARLVTLWDFNETSDCLVLIASSPRRAPRAGPHAITLQDSLTGLAVVREQCVVHNTLGETLDRRFLSPTIAVDLGLRWMISVPIRVHPSGRRAAFVMNLCFNTAQPTRDPFAGHPIGWIRKGIARTTDYIRLQRDERLRRALAEGIASATGIDELIANLRKPLSTLARQSSIRLILSENGRKPDRSVMMTGPRGSSVSMPTLTSEPLPGDEEIFAQCRGGRKSVALNRHAPNSANGRTSGEAFCSQFAVPIVGRSNRLLAVMVFSAADELGSPRNCTSFDVRSMERLSSTIGPYIDNANRVVAGTPFTDVLINVSAAMLHGSRLDEVLVKSIEATTSALHTQVGSIYVRDPEKGDYVLRAAAGHQSDLRGKARYQKGRGITGTIAAGQVLTFRSAEEMHAHPAYQGSYDQDIWGTDVARSPRNFLGVPIHVGDDVIGVWKAANLEPSPSHPEDYFTEADTQLAKVLCAFLGVLIDRDQRQAESQKQLDSLAQSTIDIENARSVDDAVTTVMLALQSTGVRRAALYLVDEPTNTLSGAVASHGDWERTISSVRVPLAGSSILAETLRTNQAQEIVDLRSHPELAAMARSTRGSHRLIPLRLDSEAIGVLDIEVDASRPATSRDQLALQAFCAHLAIAISRLRNIEKAHQLSDHVMSSSRFLAAEALASAAVHSLGHRLDDIGQQLTTDLKRPEIREHRLLNETLTRWQRVFRDEKVEVHRALAQVKQDESEDQRTDLHAELQIAVSTWYQFVRSSKSSFSLDLQAAKTITEMTGYAFREVMAVLIVNAVQAHSRTIAFRTYNETEFVLNERFTVSGAFCLDCRDDGTGISADAVESVFDPRYTTKPRRFGTGLGLFIARKLARRSGGDLVVVRDASQEKGATLRLVVPLFLPTIRSE